MLKNPSFEDGWTDLPPAPGNLTNQQPAGWTLRWLEPGESLFGSSDTAGGVPECVHKLATQLPPAEQPGGADPLILDGKTVYKVFHAGASFGTELRQTVTGLQPGSQATIRVPVRCHRHGDGDPWGAEAGVWLGDEGRWWNAEALGDRRWNTLEVSAAVPASGEVEVLIRFKSKWGRPKDFFVDDVTFEATPAGDDAGDGDNGEQPPLSIEEWLWQKSKEYQQQRGVTVRPAHGLENKVYQLIIEEPGWVIGHDETTFDAPDGERYGIMAIERVDDETRREILYFRRPWSGPGGVKVWRPGPVEKPFAFEAWPTDYRHITQRFGANPQNYTEFGLPGHEGIDIKAPHGTPVYAVAAGRVTFAGNSAGAYGNYVIVDHGGGWTTAYAHCHQLLVSAGQQVAAGQRIATADNTGNSDGSHLHLSLKRADHTYVDERGVEWPRNYHDPTPYLAPFNPTWPGQPPAQQMDLLPYLRGDGRTYMVRHPGGAEEKFRTLRDGDRWLLLKNSNYEEFWVAGDYIWRGVDTSPEPGNYYRQFEAGRQGARWCPRYMTVGQAWVAPVKHRVQTYRKSDCQPVEHHRNGETTNRVTLVGRGARIINGIELDTVELLTSTRETMWFARGYGLVAWKSDWGESAIVKVLPAGEGDNEPERGCFN